jgi:pimeloyl-ACP methyl ester carboxylesterase
VLELDPGRPPTASSLVLIHGFSDSADTWRALMNAMRGGPRRALAVDLPGFGEADRLDREAEILPQLDELVAAAVRYEALHSPTGRVTVAGNSLGGIATLRAAQDPELPIDGAVPIAPAGLDMAAWIQIIEGVWAVQAILRSPVPLPERVNRELIGQAYRRLAVASPSRADPQMIARFASHVRTKRDVVRVLGTGRRLRPELNDPFELGRITCPVLVVWGQNDRLVFPTGADRVLREVASARLITIPDCGHCPQVEYPERLLALIDELPRQDLAAAA